MKISLDQNSGAYVIHGYAPGEIRVRVPATETTVAGLTVCTRSLVITPEHLMDDWAPQSLDELAMEHLDMLEELAPEIVLIGSGPRMRLPSPHLLAPLVRLRAGFEVMDTGAACRTYNLLAGEGRRVAAALLIG